MKLVAAARPAASTYGATRAGDPELLAPAIGCRRTETLLSDATDNTPPAEAISLNTGLEERYPRLPGTSDLMGPACAAAGE